LKSNLDLGQVENPTHTYEELGNYTATLTVHDSEGNMGIDTAAVTVIYGLPVVTIARPQPGIYFFNVYLPIGGYYHIFGPITVVTEAHQSPFGIDRVEFELAGRRMKTDTNAPYTWTWLLPGFGDYLLGVRAYDTTGQSAYLDQVVRKFF
jgi:PKD repeat protein